MSLRTRLLLALGPAVLLFFGALTAGTLWESERIVLAQIHSGAPEVVRTHAQELEVLFASTAHTVEALAAAVGTSEALERAAITQLSKRLLSSSPEIFGIAVVLEPDVPGPPVTYVYRGDGGALVSLEQFGYDPWRADWYVRPFSTGQAGYGDPYFDQGGGGVLMVTYSAPIVRGDRRVGVATADLAIEGLVARLRRMELVEGGYAFLVSESGRLIAHPNLGSLSERTLEELAGGSAALARLEGMLREGGAQYERMPDPFTGADAWIIESPVGATRGAGGRSGWSLLVSIPTHAILRPLADLRTEMGALGALILALLAAAIVGISVSLTRPVLDLVRHAQRYAAGAFGERIDEGRGPRELRALARAFNAIGAAVLEQMERVRVTAASKERYRQGLAVAAEVQQSLLPNTAEAVADLSALVAVHGLMQPAEEVGGDFYDCVRLPGGRLALVVADVSDKGAPAALFMSRAHMLLRTLAERGLSPAEVLRRANAVLVRDNPASMFVTVLYAELDPSTGSVRIASAGHPPPFVLSADGAVEPLPVAPGLPLGAMAGTRYATVAAALPPGATLCLYSDGVTEATDPGGGLYGSARLRSALAACAGRGCESVAARLVADVRAFTARDALTDDLTLLLCQRTLAGEAFAGPRALDRALAVRVELPCSTSLLQPIAQLAERMAREAGLDDREVARFLLALDEVLTNAMTHAGPGGDGRVAVELAPVEGGLRAAVVDTGAPFDFAKASTAYDGRATETQPEGGIGLYLAVRSVDEVRYEADPVEGNRVILVSRHHPAGAKAG